MVLVSTLLFTAFHMSPAHTLVILPAGVFQGWRRAHTGPYLASALCHLVYCSAFAVVPYLFGTCV